MRKLKEPEYFDYINESFDLDYIGKNSVFLPTDNGGYIEIKEKTNGLLEFSDNRYYE